jgi:FtsZ-interacting cell division protein ZipA
MGLNLPTILVILGLVALTLLLTGPGLWSEKWGWRWFKDADEKKKDRRPPEPPARP